MSIKKIQRRKIKNTSAVQPKGNRTYQDTLFRFMFSNKESAIELYNALEGTDYDMDTEVEFTTLENVLYVEGRNDLGFSIAGKYVVLTEHQSTINKNMPVRFLEYVAQTYNRIMKSDDLFKRNAIPVLTPEFFVIYTGEENWNQNELRLSDSYIGNMPENSLELVVKIIDVRYNKKEAEQILSRSEKLRGYSLLLEYIREYRKESYPLREAIDKAVKRCIEEDILREFLIRYGKEARAMLYDDISVERFAEIRAEEVGEKRWEDGRQIGRAEGLAEGRAEGRRIKNLMQMLIQADRLDDLKKAAADDEYMETLLKEFNL